MAIAIRGTTPGTVGTGSNPISLTLNGTRQPQAGDLIVLFYGNDYYQLSNMPTPSFNGSTTGVTAISGGTADGGNLFAHIKSFYFVVSATGDVTISATESGAGDEEKCMVAYVLSGADTSNPIDGTATNNTDNTGTTTNRVCLAVTTTNTDSFLIAHTNDGNGSNSVSYTPPGGMTEQYDSVVLGAMGYSGATLQLAASGSTGNKTFVATNNASYGTVMVAINTAAAAGATSTPGAIVVPPAAVTRSSTW